ncbi:MAG: M23 family metallopeptidase [Bacteroidales bacterium]
MNSRNKKKNNLSGRLFEKYRLTLYKENEPEKTTSACFTRLNALLLTLSGAILFIVLILFILLTTPLGEYLPGYMDRELRSEMVRHALRVDSIAQDNLRRERYLENVLGVLRGDFSEDSIPPLDSISTLPEASAMIAFADSVPGKSERERQFVARFEQEEKYSLTILKDPVPAKGTLFYAPVRGVVTETFDPQNGRFGVEVKCARNSSVSTPLEGTVIFVSQTIESGYVMHIQHPNDFISVFRNIGTPTREISRSIPGGAVIGTQSRSVATKEQPHIYYELWYKGTPLNPEEYINF